VYRDCDLRQDCESCDLSGIPTGEKQLSDLIFPGNMARFQHFELISAEAAIWNRKFKRMIVRVTFGDPPIPPSEMHLLSYSVSEWIY